MKNSYTSLIRFSLALLLAIMAATLLACNRKGMAEPTPTVKQGQVVVIEITPTTIPFDSEAILGNIADSVVLPWYGQLIEEAEGLDLAIERFTTEPSVDSLVGAQTQWRTTSELWAKLELFDFQMTMVLHRQMNSWPVDVARLEEFVASDDDITDTYVASKGSNVKGLAAIEYLLFSPGMTAAPIAPGVVLPSRAESDPELPNELIVTQLAANPSRIAYLEGAGQALLDTATALNALWSVDGQNVREQFVDATFENGGIDGTFDVLLTAMIFRLEMVERNKLGVPLRGTDAYAKPDAVESPYANHSTALIYQSIIGLHELMEAGLYEYLLTRQSHYDSATLVNRINEQFDETFAALGEINLPLAEAVIQEPSVVANAWEAVKELSRRFEVDLTNHVGLTTSINQNDGD